MGRFSLRPHVRTPLWAIQPGQRPSQPGLKPEAWLAGWLAGPQINGQMEKRTNGWTNAWTKNLPILKDFVRYWGRCPAYAHENQESLIQK